MILTSLFGAATSLSGLLKKHHPHSDPEYAARADQLAQATRAGNVLAARRLHWGILRDHQIYGWSQYADAWGPVASTPAAQEALKQGDLTDDWGPISFDDTVPKPPQPANAPTPIAPLPITKPLVSVASSGSITPAPTTPAAPTTSPTEAPSPSWIQQLIGPIKDAFSAAAKKQQEDAAAGLASVQQAAAQQVQNAGAVASAAAASAIAPAGSNTQHAVNIPTDRNTLILVGVGVVALVGLVLFAERR